MKAAKEEERAQMAFKFTNPYHTQIVEALFAGIDIPCTRMLFLQQTS